MQNRVGGLQRQRCTRRAGIGFFTPRMSATCERCAAAHALLDVIQDEAWTPMTNLLEALAAQAIGTPLESTLNRALDLLSMASEGQWALLDLLLAAKPAGRRFDDDRSEVALRAQ